MAKQKPYAANNLRNALAEDSEGSSMHSAAHKFGIPPTT